MHPTNPSDARERIAQNIVETWLGHDGRLSTVSRCFLTDAIVAALASQADRIAELESEACLKDAYAYELQTQRDEAITEASDLREALLQATTPPAFTEEMGSGDT